MFCAAIQTWTGAPAVWTQPERQWRDPSQLSVISFNCSSPPIVTTAAAAASLRSGQTVKPASSVHSVPLVCACSMHTPCTHPFLKTQSVTCKHRNSCSWLQSQSCLRCPHSLRTRTVHRHWHQGRSTTWQHTVDRDLGPEADCTLHLKG